MKEDVCYIPDWVKFDDITITAFMEDGLSVIETKLDTPLMLDSSIAAMCMDSWGRSMRVFSHVLNECNKKIISDGLNNLKNPRQAIRGIPVGLMVGSKVCFKPTKQVYQPVAKNNGASANDKHKQARLTRQEVSNSNLFDALNTVENDYDLGTNGENLKLAQKGANFDVVSSSHRTSSKVDDPVNVDSDSKVEEMFDKTTSFMASTSFKVNKSGPSARFIVLFDSSHHSGAKSADPEVDFLVRSAAPVMTEATTVATVTTTVVIPADVSKDKSAPHPSVFGSSSSSENTDHTLSLFIGRSGSGFAAGSIRAEEVIGAGLEEIYVPKWTVTKGFELNEGHSCANMIDHFTPLTFFKTVRRMKHEQLFAEFNVSAACNLSLSSEVRMRVEYNILEKRKWKSLAEEKDYLLGARDKEMEELKSQLLKAKEESVEVAQLRAQVSGLEATENSLRGEVTSTKEHNVLLEQECDSLKLKVMSLESTIAEKDHELSDLGASSSSLKSQNQSLVNQVHELETSSTDLCEKLEMYEESLKQLEEFQDNLMRPLETRLAEIHADFTRCCMRFQESFHPHLLNIIAGRRWLLAHGMKLLVVKCLNSTEYMEALRDAFGQADFNSAIRDLRGLNFLLLQELSNKKDASKWDIMDLLCLDDAVAETLAFSVALDIFRRRVEKMERNLVERLPFLKDVFVSIDYPLSAEALIEPPVEVPATNVLSTVVIVPHSGPLVFVEDYDNPDLADVVSENVTSGPEGEEKIDASAGGDLAFSQLDDEARDAVL
ncbi:hypothetical protein Tco_1130971 [Tanacetum coccineum]